MANIKRHRSAPLITRLALSDEPVGKKLKHFRAAFPDYDDKIIEAAHAEYKRIDAIRSERFRRRIDDRPDPLIGAAVSRPYRTPSALAKAAEQERQRREQLDREVDRIRRLNALNGEIRKSLIASGRVARKMGYRVDVSRMKGAISSYYINLGDGRRLRISDHEIPQSWERDARAADRGQSFYDGWPGPEIIIDRPRRPEWLRRAIILVANGRSPQ